MVDLESEGLLDGAADHDREERRALLLELLADGVAVEELRQAVSEDRLAMLPVERALLGAPAYTLDDLAGATGAPREFLLASRRAAGLPRPADGERCFAERDLVAARIYARFLDSGLPRDRLLEVIAVVGRGLAHAADAILGLTSEAFLMSGVTERDLGLTNARATRELLPLVGPILDYTLRSHLLDRMRDEITQSVLLAAGARPDQRRVAVCFADLVGFTALGELVPSREVGAVVLRLQDLAAELVQAPVRLVKVVGDAVMLVSAEPDALVTCAQGLIRAAAEPGSLLPPLRAGVALGTAITRSGDWFGRPVNLAARIASIAPPGTVMASGAVAHMTAEKYVWQTRGGHIFKGITDLVDVFELSDGAAPTAPDSATLSAST